MTKLEVIILFVVYLKTNSITACFRPAGAPHPHHTNDTILKIIDNLFIYLKIRNSNLQYLTISKNSEEYKSRTSLIQNAICSNHKIYKSVHDMSKTKISNKIAYYISNINEAIEEMIRSEGVKNIRNDTKTYTLDDENVKDFIKLARRFNLKLKTIASIITVPKVSKEQEEGRRIFAGSSAGIARYPFMASVHVAGRFVCAGSLLHESLVLSAASCLMRTVETKAHIQIRVASDYVSKMGSLVNIEELIFHPEFDRASLENNLVLLRTKKPLRFRQQLVMAIQYDRPNASALRPGAGAGAGAGAGEGAGAGDLVILGWGKRRTDGSDVRDADRPLSEGHIQLYDFNACQYIYTRDFVTDKSFCAGFVDRGAGACNHDAGGPALVGGVLVGVISFGSSRCGAADAPTVLTRLAPHAAWIDAVFRSLAPTQENNLEEQINNSNTLREEANLDQAVKDIYRDNFNVDEVLYGPIDPLYDGEMSNMSTKLLRDYPTDPGMFPNPQLVAHVPSARPLLPAAAEPPAGFWKDSSIEQTTTQTNDDHKSPARQFASDTSTLHYSNVYQTTNQAGTDLIDSIYGPLLDIYADNDDTLTSTTTEATEESVYAKKNTEIKVNRQLYDSEPVYVEGRPEKSSEASVPQDLNRYSPTSRSVRYNDRPYTRFFPLPPGDAVAHAPDQRKQTGTAKAENSEVIEKAVIVLGDSGTTQVIELNKMDPLYQQGFKKLAARIIGNGVN